MVAILQPTGRVLADRLQVGGLVGGKAHIDVGRRHRQGLQPLDLAGIAHESAGTCQEREALAATLPAQSQGLRTDDHEASFLGQPDDNGALRHGGKTSGRAERCEGPKLGLIFAMQPASRPGVEVWAGGVSANGPRRERSGNVPKIPVTQIRAVGGDAFSHARRGRDGLRDLHARALGHRDELERRRPAHQGLRSLRDRGPSFLDLLRRRRSPGGRAATRS